MRACAVLGEVGVDGSGAGLQARRVEVGGRGAAEIVAQAGSAAAYAVGAGLMAARGVWSTRRARRRCAALAIGL